MFSTLLMVVVGSSLGIGEPLPPTAKPPIRVGQIFIIGNDVTPQTIILSMLPLFPGAVLSDSDFQTARQQLRWLTVLGIGATVATLPHEEGAWSDIRVDVRETPLTYFTIWAPNRIRSFLWGE